MFIFFREGWHYRETFVRTMLQNLKNLRTFWLRFVIFDSIEIGWKLWGFNYLSFFEWSREKSSQNTFRKWVWGETSTDLSCHVTAFLFSFHQNSKHIATAFIRTQLSVANQSSCNILVWNHRLQTCNPTKNRPVFY